MICNIFLLSYIFKVHEIRLFGEHNLEFTRREINLKVIIVFHFQGIKKLPCMLITERGRVCGWLGLV